VKNKKQPLRILLFLLLCTGSQADDSFTESSCKGGGGSGPTPVASVTPIPPTAIKPISSIADMKEFVISEARDRVFYRNEGGEISAVASSGATESLPSLSTPLSQIIDTEGRFLLASGRNVFLDTLNPDGWMSFASPGTHPRNLFWHDQVLYGASLKRDLGLAPRWRIYQYQPGDRWAHWVCLNQNFPLHDGFKLGEGSEYPYAVFYRADFDGTNTDLLVKKLDLRTCDFIQNDYTHPVTGRVTNVHWFNSVSSTLIETDHTYNQLLWDTHQDEKHCHYYHLDGKILVTGHSIPTVAVFNPREGVTLFHMHNPDNSPPRAQRLLSGLPITDLKRGGATLAKDGKALYLSPQLNAETQVLLKASLTTE